MKAISKYLIIVFIAEELISGQLLQAVVENVSKRDEPIQCSSEALNPHPWSVEQPSTNCLTQASTEAPSENYSFNPPLEEVWKDVGTIDWALIGESWSAAMDFLFEEPTATQLPVAHQPVANTQATDLMCLIEKENESQADSLAYNELNLELQEPEEPASPPEVLIVEKPSSEKKTKENKGKKRVAENSKRKSGSKDSSKLAQKNLKTVTRKLALAAEKVATKMKYSERCKDEFINANGLGKWGRYITKEISRKPYESLLTNNKAFRNFCPGFRYMSNEEKKNLWVFIVMSMSHYESSCRPNVEAQGPYGIAKGLFQLHAGSENQYFKWDQDRICRRGDSKKPIESIQCTLSMLSGQVERYNSLFYEGSYWDVLRKSSNPDTHAGKIKRAVKMIPGCEARSIAADEKVKGRNNG